MAITTSNRSWAPAWTVNFLYAALGFGAAYSSVRFPVVESHIPMIARMAAIAQDESAVRSFFSVAWLTLPLALLLLCLVAPIKIKAGDAAEQKAGLILGAIVFSFLLTPFALYSSFVAPEIIFSGSRRLLGLTTLMGTSPAAVALVGGAWMSSLLWLCWISYWGIPTLFVKLTTNIQRNEK